MDLQSVLITFGETKNGTIRHIPLNKAARQVIEGLYLLREEHPWVPYFGGDCKENWWKIRKLTCKACDAGVDLRTLVELPEYKTLEMGMRDSHLSPEHKAAVVALLNDLEKEPDREKGSRSFLMNKTSTRQLRRSEREDYFNLANPANYRF